MLDDGYREEIKQKITETFYWLHQHPELSYEEYETTGRLRDVLVSAAIKILDLPLATGLVAEVGQGEPLIALRADIDALPIAEQTDLPYRSQQTGKMHACGHDFHAAALLGAALLLKREEAQLPGKVLLIFQPAEEAPGGAKKILETGVLDGVRAIFGLHTSPLFAVGEVGLMAGPVMAAVDRFNVEFQGKGAHAAHPERGNDTILMGASFVTSLQSIVSRNVSPLEAAVVTVTQFHGGNTWNVIPGKVQLEGTVRTQTPEARAFIKRRLQEIAQGVAASFGGTAVVNYVAGPPVTYNDAHLYEFARQTAQNTSLIERQAPASLGGEDFAYYLEKIPGMFSLIGTGIGPVNHNPKFTADPQALYPAADYMARLAQGALRQEVWKHD
ncbi:amidohydrolase [Selenomonas ruminis]|uniref:Amidohydrolase n=1 Tax=Selenomonas ruminis TaxID=2593411 RepID=A0A5D6W543_9FIRM|nr:amidohydrolase [Selenomonas sp. mPRGC5]TYZ21945.1 amidohydrolase [Selenomonas sp. mPRGC5]